jgi:hypothetical protein
MLLRTPYPECGSIIGSPAHLSHETDLAKAEAGQCMSEVSIENKGHYGG